MISSVVVFLVVLSFLSTGSKMSDGKGEVLKWTNYTEGVKFAQAAHKKMLIDVYTDWCGWCKKMENDTYSDKEVGNYLATNYVTIKLDAESDVKEQVGNEQMTQAEIARAYRVDDYPTTIFVSATGEPITSVPGYLKPSEFLSVMKYIGEDYYKKMNYQDYLNLLNVPVK